jgi:uncharacterized protein (DUF433 family)
LVDVGFLVANDLPVGLADGTDQPFHMQGRFVGAVTCSVGSRLQTDDAPLEEEPEAVRMAKSALLMLCVSTVTAVGMMWEVFRYQISNKWVERTSEVVMKLDRITVNPEIMNGQPCLRGMRLTVRRLVEAVALYPDRAELKAEYPELDDEDIRQALEFAALSLADEILPLEAA